MVTCYAEVDYPPLALGRLACRSRSVTDLLGRLAPLLAEDDLIDRGRFLHEERLHGSQGIIVVGNGVRLVGRPRPNGDRSDEVQIPYIEVARIGVADEVPVFVGGFVGSMRGKLQRHIVRGKDLLTIV